MDCFLQHPKVRNGTLELIGATGSVLKVLVQFEPYGRLLCSSVVNRASTRVWYTYNRSRLHKQVPSMPYFPCLETTTPSSNPICNMCAVISHIQTKRQRKREEEHHFLTLPTQCLTGDSCVLTHQTSVLYKLPVGSKRY